MADDLEQAARHRRFAVDEPGAWTTVYSFRNDGDASYFSALSPVSRRTQALADPGWDLSIGAGGPGFSQSCSDGEPETEYHRWGGRDGVEPLVLHRQFHGARPSYLEVVEEFRLFHNLYWDATASCFVKPYDDGTAETAVEMRPEKVLIRTKLLRQYQAARQLDLLTFVDSRAHAGSADAPLPPEQTWRTDSVHAVRYRGAIMARPITRYLGTRVFPAPPVEKSGVWPYEDADTHFPDFVIGEGAHGEEIRHSCDPDRLANYFRANPDAPHYLTPIHFRREVLQRYYSNPELYQVADGSLTCAGLWTVSIDNDSTDGVIVFLGDLGRDLPSRERDYWRTFNVAPARGMSDTCVRRAFLGEFSDPQAPDLIFRRTYDTFRTDWLQGAGYPLLRDLSGPDRALPQQLRVPLSGSQNEFEEAIRVLAKLLCDALDDKAIQRRLPNKVHDEKSIAKLGRLLAAEGYPGTERAIAFLQRLQALRSKTAAHLKGSNYDEELTRLIGEADLTAAVVALLQDGRSMLESLIDWKRTGSGTGARND